MRHCIWPRKGCHSLFYVVQLLFLADKKMSLDFFYPINIIKNLYLLCALNRFLFGRKVSEKLNNIHSQIFLLFPAVIINIILLMAIFFVCIIVRTVSFTHSFRQDYRKYRILLIVAWHFCYLFAWLRRIKLFENVMWTGRSKGITCIFIYIIRTQRCSIGLQICFVRFSPHSSE